MRRRPRSRVRRARLGELPDLEDLGPAVRARALNSRATVLHRDLLRILDLDLLAFLDAIALRHRGPPFETIPRVTLEQQSDRRGSHAQIKWRMPLSTASWWRRASSPCWSCLRWPRPCRARPRPPGSAASRCSPRPAPAASAGSK